MSTWWYLQCLDHDPPIRSNDEVEQHTYGLPAIRALFEQRATIAAMPDFYPEDYFARNAVGFLRQHPTCRMSLINEYGEEESIEESA